jgi:SPP1 gp7 family putative phage head morphogenesis protein
MALLNMVNDAFKGSFEDFDIDTPKGKKIRQLYKNSFVFSGAKTFQQTKDMGNELFNKEGVKVSFKEFREKAGGIFDTYNKNWLKVEMDTAYHVSLGASQWQDQWADRDIFGLLEYQTAGDERVRASHAVLDNITKKITDPFWDTYYPPNGWNCRCDVLQHEVGDRNITDTKDLTYKPEKLFNMNPGKSDYIFDPNVHPYFKVEKKYEVLKKNNFNLPIPKYE